MPMVSRGPATEAQLRNKQEQQNLQYNLARQNRSNQEADVYNQIARMNALAELVRARYNVQSERIRQSQTEAPSGYMNARRLLGY